MAKSFRLLRERMGPEAVARASARAAELARAIPRRVARSGGLSHHNTSAPASAASAEATCVSPLIGSLKTSESRCMFSSHTAPRCA